MDPNNQDIAKGESCESKTLRAHTCAMHPLQLMRTGQSQQVIMFRKETRYRSTSLPEGCWQCAVRTSHSKTELNTLRRCAFFN